MPSKQTVDELQKILGSTVFTHTTDRKKAAGRALGTIVELITYYKLAGWNLLDHTLIEQRVAEFGRSDLTHNVEFSMHPVLEAFDIRIAKSDRSITKTTLQRAGAPAQFLDGNTRTILAKGGLLTNAVVTRVETDAIAMANLVGSEDKYFSFRLTRLARSPVAIIECKRVGVQEGMAKGPQTIEKAKQGAYVARTISSLQRITRQDGARLGYLPVGDQYEIGDYLDIFDSIISGDRARPAGFVATIGVVSNHGNWFTASNMNKELKVLAQSYDILLFLSDTGLVDFVRTFLTNRTAANFHVHDAFRSSYTQGRSGKNSFTKTQINFHADLTLRRYFEDNKDQTNAWFNVLNPIGRSMNTLFDGVADLLKRLSR